MRYIDADKLIQRFRPFTDVFGTKMVHIDSVVHVIKNEPTADVVEVVRCKDCKHLDKGENDSESWCECTAHFGKYFDVNENGFCSFGERADK